MSQHEPKNIQNKLNSLHVEVNLMTENIRIFQPKFRKGYFCLSFIILYDRIPFRVHKIDKGIRTNLGCFLICNAYRRTYSN